MRRLLLFLALFVSIAAFAGITVTGVDVTDYPKVVVYAHIDVPDPESAEYTVYEDGKAFAATLQDFKTLSRKPKVDFIFVFDITGSMEDEIEGVKEKAKQFADTVGRAGFDYRFSLVTFKDRVFKGDYGFTSDVYTFKRWLSSLEAEGGGDTPEAALDALAYAMRLPVRRDAQRILVLITDAPYHHRVDGSGFSKYTASDIREMLRRLGFTIYSVSPKSSEYESLVRGFGKVFDIHSREGFGSIIDAIASTFVSQIALVYITDEREGGSKVKFKVDVAYSGSKGRGHFEGWGSYEVPPRPKIEKLTITQEGYGVVDPTKQEEQAILLAREAAILDAKRSILEALGRVYIDKEMTVRDAMVENEDLASAIQGAIAGGQVVDEGYDEMFGIYHVKVRVDLERVFDNILKTSTYRPIWRNKIVVARGVVVINKKIRPMGRAILMARRGAIAEAQAKLLEAVKGVHIDARTTVKDKMTESVEITARVEGILRGAIVIDEMKNHMSMSEIWDKGYYWVSMAVALDERGLQYLLEKYGQSGAGDLAVALQIPKGTPKLVEPPSKPKKVEFTWLIIDAKGFKVVPTFKGYYIYSKDGRLVFDPSMSKAAMAMDYRMMMEIAEKKAGGKPMIVKVLQVDLDNEKIVLDADYDTLYSLLIEKGLGYSGSITVVTDKLGAMARER